ncbi:MAG: T9SS type A sorting domain-containing protein [Flavobacteriales bacterium]
MNRKLLALTIFTLIASAARTQGIVGIRNADGDLVNGSVVFVQTDISEPLSDMGLRCELLEGTDPQQINVRRYEMWPVAGSSNYFCWGVCYNPVASGVNPTWLSQHYVNMTPGVPVNNFHAYYEPNNTPGTSRFRFVWFRTADPDAADSSWVDIDFGAAVGIQERRDQLIGMQLMPNPALDGDMRISVELAQAGQNAGLVIYNALGSKVQQHKLTPGVTVVTLRREDMVSGIYFASVEVDGRILDNKRIIIGSRR